MFDKLGRDNYLRVVHAADMVAHWPAMAGLFAHSGQEIWYPKHDMKYKACAWTRDTLEDKTCSNSLLMTISTADHLTYLKVRLWSTCRNPFLIAVKN
jgi:hypothetical protein